MARKKARRSSSLALAPRRSRGAAKHHAPKSGGLGSFATNNPRTGALVAAALLGIAKARGWEIPYLETAGEAGTFALAGYAAENFLGVKHPMVRHATTAFAVIAVHDWFSEHGGADLTKTHKKDTTPATVKGDVEVVGNYRT